MPPSLLPSLVVTFALLLAPVARPEPPLRRESNASIRNEVQLAIDKGLAHLLGTQRADGSWGKMGTTGFTLMALRGDPRGRGWALKGAEFEAPLERGYASLRQAFAVKGGLQKIDDFAWNVPPAVLVFTSSRDKRDVDLVTRVREEIGTAPLPEPAETRAFFLGLDPKNRSPGALPSPLTGSAIAAWLWMSLQHFNYTGVRLKPAETAAAWLREHYTLERNPAGEGVHQYYFWLSHVMGQSPLPPVGPDLKLPDGVIVDIPRHLAEKLINEQNGNGSWSGVGDHWTEKDPDLVTAMCVLTLEQVYRQL
jgi:hypothetical protein